MRERGEYKGGGKDAERERRESGNECETGTGRKVAREGLSESQQSKWNLRLL